MELKVWIWTCEDSPGSTKNTPIHSLSSLSEIHKKYLGNFSADPSKICYSAVRALIMHVDWIDEIMTYHQSLTYFSGFGHRSRHGSSRGSRNSYDDQRIPYSNPLGLGINLEPFFSDFGFTSFGSVTSTVGGNNPNVQRTSTSTRFINGNKITKIK